MTDLAARVQALEDRAELTELVARYARACDAPDPAAIVRCFASDGRFHTADGTVDVIGHEAIEAFYTEAFGGELLAPPARSMHLMHNLSIAVDGDSADLRIGAVVLRWVHGAEGLVQRGIRSHDTAVRTPDGWRLADREHRLEWQHED